MEQLIDDAELARAFIERLKTFVEELRTAIDGNLKRVLGPVLQRDWSAWVSLEFGMSTEKFDALLTELKKTLDKLVFELEKSTGSSQQIRDWWEVSEQELRAAFIGYRGWWDARTHQRRTGNIAGTLRPKKSVELIERRLEMMGIELVRLREPENFCKLADTHILGRSQDGEYGLATTTGQALTIMLDDAPKYFGPLSDGRLAWMKGYASFQLFFNGLHSGSYATAEFALKRLAAADVTGDRAVCAMHLHAQNLFAERTRKVPDTQLALAALSLDTADGSLPLLENVERTIRRRAALGLVRDGHPLEHKPDDDKTLEQLLIGYRDEAYKIGALPSLVVDNIGLMEVMLRHGRIGAAQQYHSEAYLALRNSKTTANMRLFESATLLMEAQYRSKK